MISQKQFEAVCNRIEETTLSIPRICKEVGISSASFYEFKKTSEQAEKKYARSKEIQCELMAEEILDIADDGSNDFMTVVKGDEKYEIERKEVVNRSRLRVDSRKWLLSKLIPKKFGDKIEVDNNHRFPSGININFNRGDRSQKKKND